MPLQVIIGVYPPVEGVSARGQGQALPLQVTIGAYPPVEGVPIQGRGKPCPYGWFSI